MNEKDDVFTTRLKLFLENVSVDSEAEKEELEYLISHVKNWQNVSETVVITPAFPETGVCPHCDIDEDGVVIFKSGKFLPRGAEYIAECTQCGCIFKDIDALDFDDYQIIKPGDPNMYMPDDC